MTTTPSPTALAARAAVLNLADLACQATNVGDWECRVTLEDWIEFVRDALAEGLEGMDIVPDSQVVAVAGMLLARQEADRA